MNDREYIDALERNLKAMTERAETAECNIALLQKNYNDMLALAMRQRQFIRNLADEARVYLESEND